MGGGVLLRLGPYSERTPAARARSYFAKARTVKRNQRLGRYQGRNSASTDRELRATLKAARRCQLACDRRVQGLLQAENDLAERVSINRDAGQDRPELRARLNRVRAELRAVEDAGWGLAP